MNLFDIISVKRSPILEGGNLSSHNAQGKEIPGWQGVPGTHQAQELDLQVHNRSYVQDVVEKLLADINTTFSNQYKEPLWYPKSVEAKKFLSGSTLLFLDKKISDEDFVRVKPKVGDIDTQAPDKHAETIKQFLQSLVGKKVGDAVFLGFSPGNSQYSSLWEIKLKELPVKIQIDFEYGAHDDEGLPTDWQSYSHSSAWEDLSANIKGVFHKYIDRALPYARTSTKYVARVLKKSTKISDEPVTDSDFSFAVSGPGGGGLSRKYVPYNDPNTGEPMEKNGVPVMQLLEPNARQYIQNLAQQFELFFGRKPKGNDQELKNSFVGTVALIAKYLPNDEKEEIVSRFLSICFEHGSQMITKDDPARDRDIKFAAIDHMLEHIKLPSAKSLRAQAVKMAADYEAIFTNKAATRQPVAEAEVKAQLRKGMPHLKDLKAADFLDLLDEIHDGNGNFKLENMPLNVKIDGFGGRFGKNADGKPFMGTSRTEPRYAPGFLKYHQEKGTQDPEILGRAKLFDDLFVEMMNAVKLVDSKLGPDFLIDKQVSCEVLFLPFATETEEGKLKFVGIHYDKLPEGVQLALVPFQVVTASTGEPIENSQEVVKELTGLGQQGSVMFIDNSLTQNEALDVTAIVPPLENIEELKSIVSDTMGKRDRASLELKKNVEAQLQPVKLALEKAIAEDPNIVGKDMLGQDYEGIVLNTRLGPVKITSQEQRTLIANKQAAKTSARTERPRGEAKTAVVAIGSFIGHKGHEELFNYTINKAKELGGDPYLFIGNAEGKDDPIPPAVKVQTWHKLYPEYANNISTVQQGGQLIQKIKHELINPLPGKPPRYDNIVIMVGEDRKDLNMPQALMKAVNKFQGYEHVKVSLGVTPRGTGISGTLLRNSLKNDPPEKALATWSNAFDVKKLGKDWIEHLMDITRQGMGIKNTQQTPQPQPAPVVAERLFNALMRPNKEINESTSIDSALKIVVNDIGEPITAVYDKLKFMAKRYVHDHGELNRGWKMVEMGEGARWVQGMYNAQLKGALYALIKYNPKRTGDLQQFLAGREVNGEIELKRSFNNISNELPEILAKVGNYIESPELTKAARRWMQNKTEYENYIDSLGDNEDDYDTPTVKPEKSKLPGQQNAQADQIVNDILKRLPSKVAGDIRNAIARGPNKLQALQAELQKRGVKAPMAESLIESARMSAAVKLQRAWEREQAKSTASRKRGEEYMAQIKQDVANKNKKPDAPKDVEDESIMGFLATPKHPVAKKSTTSSADMRKYFEKDKPANPEKAERGNGGKKVQQVYTRSDESILNELDMFAPRTVYFKMGDGNYIKADYRGSETMFGGGHKANDQVNFTSMSWVPTNAARSLGLDKWLAKGTDPAGTNIDANDPRSKNAHSIVSPQSAGQAGPWGQRSLDVVDFINSKEDTVPSELKTQVAQWVEKNRPKTQTPAQGVAEGVETPQQQQVRAAISKGMEKWDQNGLATYQSQPAKRHYFASSDWASGQLKGINSIDPDGTVVIELNDTTTAGLVKKLAALGGMPGVKTRQLKMTFDLANADGVTRGDVTEGDDDKFSVADKVEELVDQYRLYDKRGWTDLFTKLAGRKLEVAEIRREMEYASKFLDLLDSIRMRSDYRGQQDPRLDQELIDLSNQWLGLFNKATGEFKGMIGQGVAEGSSGAKYKVRSIGQDKKGEYYISPSTGEKVYKKAKVGDHEVPGSKEIKPRVAESEKTSQTDKSDQSSTNKEKKATPSQVEKNKEKWEPKQDKKGSNFDKVAESYNIKERSKYWAGKLNELEKNQFVGVKQNPLGTAGQLKATDKYAKAGDLVGETDKKKGVDGKACWDGYRYDGTENGSDRCIKVSEAVEQKMANLIEVLKNK